MNMATITKRAVFTADTKQKLGEVALTPSRNERYWDMSDEPDGKLAIVDAWEVLTMRQRKALGITGDRQIFIAP